MGGASIITARAVCLMWSYKDILPLWHVRAQWGESSVKLSVQSSVKVTGVTVYTLMSLLVRLRLCLMWASISGREYTAYNTKSLWSVSSRKLLHILFVKHFLHFKVQFLIQTMFWSQSFLFCSHPDVSENETNLRSKCSVHCLMNKDTDGY